MAWISYPSLNLFAEVFAGAPEKSELLPERYRAVAGMLGERWRWR